MTTSTNTTIHQVDEMLAATEKKLRDELERVIRARSELGVRRGRRPKELTAKG